MIMVSSTIIGYMLSLKYKMRRWILKSLISSLNLFKIEIMYAKTPLNEVLYKIANSSDISVNILFRETAKILNNNSGYTAGEAWEISLNNWKSDYLKKEDREILTSFGYGLGNSDVYNQEKNFELAIELLKKQLENAEEEGRKSEKLYRNIGFLTGLAIIILFI